jgi:hypothetical protein
MTSTRELEFILSEAKDHRDRAVHERRYDGASPERPAIVEQICVRAE